jgi:exosortase A
VTTTSRADPGAPRTFLAILPLHTVLIVALFVAVVVLYWPTIASIVDLWSYDGFKHCSLIPFVSAFLLWHGRTRGDVQLRGNWLGAVALLGAVSVWLIARQTMIQVIEQLAVLAMLHTVVLGVLGAAVYRQSIFALGYLVLAIPLGIEAIPWLMRVTADVASIALNALGMPVLREGMYFTLPGGRFEVATACSGFRYLNAALALSVLIAYFEFRSWAKRTLFIAGAVAAVMVVNGLRAMLVMAIASWSEMRYMTGVDHVWLGWGLFLVFVIALYWVAGKLGDHARR